MLKPVLLVRGDNNDVDEAALSALGIPTLIDPYIEIEVATNSSQGEHLLDVLESSDQTIWILATSVNALKFWAQIVGEDRLRATIMARANIRFAAVGETTAGALGNLGGKDIFIPSQATGKSLAEELVLAHPTSHAVIPGGNLAMKTLPSALVASGWQVSTGVVYTTAMVGKEPKSAQLVRNHEISAILLRSPSAVRALTHFVPNPAVPLVCAGITTAQALEEQGLRAAAISPEPIAQVVASTIYSLLC